MKKRRLVVPVLLLLCAAAAQARSNSDTAASAGDPIIVTVDNYVRAESDVSFAGVVKMDGFGKFAHLHEPAPLDKQFVVRPNRDTLYSNAIFDLDAGPATVTLPEAGSRFMSMQVIDEDQYTPAVYYGAVHRPALSAACGNSE